MRAWHNSPELKAEVFARMLQHRIEDSIVQGLYQEYAPHLASQYKGCLIGCTLPMAKKYPSTQAGEQLHISGWHQRVEELYGIPTYLNHLFDGLFESLPKSRAAWFATATIEAIPVGADLSGVGDLLLQDMHDMAKRGRKNFTFTREEYANEWTEPTEWLTEARRDFLSKYENWDRGHSTTYRKKAVILAERLLVHLANAPVETPVVETPVQETVTPTPEEIYA